VVHPLQLAVMAVEIETVSSQLSPGVRRGRTKGENHSSPVILKEHCLV
jgi:hypothetical protein